MAYTPKVFNLGGIVELVFAQLDWAPEQSKIAKQRVREFVDRAYMGLAKDAPYLFFDDEVRWPVHPDAFPGDATDTLQVYQDAWTLRTALPVGDPLALVWETDRKWDGRNLLLKIPNVPDGSDQWKMIRIREVWTEVIAGVGEFVFITLETPWQNITDTDIEFHVLNNEYTFPDDIIEVKNISLLEEATSYPYPLAIIGQSQAEYATFPNNTRIQTAGPPRVAYRRENQAVLRAPTAAPPVSVVPIAPGWVGPEPEGEFEYLITYAWGRQELLEHNPGPLTQTEALPVARRLDPYWESAPSPVSGSIQPAGNVIVLQLPNIDFQLAFEGVPATQGRYHRSGIKKRIWRRRLSIEASPANPTEVSNHFYLLDVVEGHETTYNDDGAITPDYNRPLREIHSYQTFRLYPRPEKRYTLVIRATRRPAVMADDTDVPNMVRDGTEALILGAMEMLYESQGNSSMADRTSTKYEKELFKMAKRYGDLRPANRLRRRRVSRPQRRHVWRRDVSGIVRNS
tara:strand:- start:224 stop:1762 length:1539 start_codon:yes stop_codon:yes gene_type:complete